MIRNSSVNSNSPVEMFNRGECPYILGQRLILLLYNPRLYSILSFYHIGFYICIGIEIYDWAKSIIII